MKEQVAEKSAQQRADKTGEPYVMVRAKNGQWMCEKKSFADSHYPATAERRQFDPKK